MFPNNQMGSSDYFVQGSCYSWTENVPLLILYIFMEPVTDLELDPLGGQTKFGVYHHISSCFAYMQAIIADCRLVLDVYIY